jgi:ubiquinone/menaquinone biosynthesis C-methylase UbiE
VWDCGCGNGQATTSLAKRFDRVIATDASAEQVARAEPAANVEYRVAPAEASGLENGSIGLVTVAQALHWFDHDAFAREVRRVATRDAVIAVWSYASCHAGEDVEALLREFEDGTVGPYWNARRKWVDEKYQTIPFPYDEVPAPTFALHKAWTLDQLGGYLRSWSAVGSYVREHEQDPVTPFLERLGRVWGPAGRTRDVQWPLYMRVGRVG